MWSGTFFTAPKNVFPWNFIRKIFQLQDATYWNWEKNRKSKGTPMALRRFEFLSWYKHAFEVLSLKLVCEVILNSDFSHFSWKFSEEKQIYFFLHIKMYGMGKLFPMQSCVIVMDFPHANIERF